MTSPLTPPFFAEAPAPAPASYGLFSAALGPLEMTTPHMVSGIQYLSDDCGVGRLYQAKCDSTPPSKTFDEIQGPVNGLPYVGYASVLCGTQTFSFDEVAAKAQRRLAAREQTLVESMLWGDAVGDTISYFHEAAPTTGITVVNLGPAASLVAGMALLEQQMASCYGHPSLIHMRPRMSAYVGRDYQAARWDGTVWRTHAGNVIVFGNGYSGLGIAADPPTATTEWIYATGRVVVWRNGVEVPDPRQTLLRSTNQYRVIAERNYVVAVECCIAAVEVTLP